MKIFVDQPFQEGGTVVVRDEFWNHYVTTVRRCREGDRVEVVGPDRVGDGRLEATEPLTVAVESTRDARQPQYRLHVCQAISRKQKYDDLIRRASDIGVTDFVPVISEHTVRRPNKPEKQRDRWRRMALESARVSDRDWVSTIHPITDWSDVFDSLSEDLTICWGDPDGDPPREAFADTGNEVALFIGPEGGFTGEERSRLAEHGQSVSLGPDNHRAETASVMLATLWLHNVNHFR